VLGDSRAEVNSAHLVLQSDPSLVLCVFVRRRGHMRARGPVGGRRALGAGTGAACVGAPGPLWLLGALRLRCVWVWDRQVLVCVGDMSVG
jgi:hypothetical protein